MPELWPVFEKLLKPVSTRDDTDILERFIVLTYKRTLTYSKVNEARKHLFGLGIVKLKPSLQANQLLLNIFKERYIRQAILGDRHLFLPQFFRSLLNGVGKKQKTFGNRFEPIFLKLLKAAES